MKWGRKIILTAAAIMTLLGTAAKAEFYNDFEWERIPVESMQDGVSFVAFEDYFDMPVFKLSQSGEKYLITADEYELYVTPGSVEAEFNGEDIVLPAAPYLSEHGLCMPARAMFELGGMYVSYDETFLKSYAPVINIYSGKDIQEISGIVADKMYGWIVNVPDGYYYYTDSVDANTAWIDNFNGIKLEIRVVSQKGNADEPTSTEIDGLLERREVVMGENGWLLSLTGKIYSNASDKTRTELNRIMDSFTGVYSRQAYNVSNISEDGAKWEIESIRPGVAFDVPVGWDVEGEKIGYSYGENLALDIEIYDNPSGNIQEILDDVYEYYNPIYGNIEHSDFSYEDHDVHMSAYYINKKSRNIYEIRFFINENDHLYLFSIETSCDATEYASIPQSFIDKAKEGMYIILSTLRLSDPGSSLSEPEIIDFAADTEEISIGGLNFMIPGYISYNKFVYGETESAIISSTLGHSYLSIVYPMENIMFDREGNTFGEMIDDISERSDLISLNGINFLRFVDETGDFVIYVSVEENVVITVNINENEIGSAHEKDIISIIESVHK